MKLNIAVNKINLNINSLFRFPLRIKYHSFKWNYNFGYLTNFKQNKTEQYKILIRYVLKVVILVEYFR